MAREGEPFWPFEPEMKILLRKKIQAMAQQLAEEHALGRRSQRAAEEGRRPLGSRLDCPSAGAIWSWHRLYFEEEPGGVFGLIDGRRLRGYAQFPSLDPEIKRVAEEVVARQDGTESTPRKNVIYRRVTEMLLAAGVTWEQIPERTLREYISHLCKPLGRTTRAHKSNALRLTASYQSFPALAIGQIVAIDVTRADNFCYDPFTGKPVSVEVITAIDLAGRIVVACRVVPRSGAGQGRAGHRPVEAAPDRNPRHPRDPS